jgi:predicted ATPase
MRPGPEPVPTPSAGDWSALKDAVRRFEQAWRGAARPRIDDYLPAGGPLRSRALVELAHIDLELRLKSGEAARVEEYLAGHPELAGDRAVVLGLIAAERSLRRRLEPGIDPEEYPRRFPQYRDELAAQLAGLATAVGAPSPGPGAETPPAVDGYEVLGLLGRGGMGVVYRARQRSLGRAVALKFLPAECARDPAWLERFRREALTASALNHPHICTIYDTGESGGRPFLSMELVEGRTLESMLGRPRPAEELAPLFRQAAQALAAAHTAGVVHRDVKPANLMVRGDGIVKVLDFGLARRLPAGAAAGPAPGDRITDPGTLVGTPLYMSPEQARGEPVGAASDVFSLGVVLYELATGQHPFRADSELGILYAIATQAPVAPSRLNPEVPAALDELIQGMLARAAPLRPTAAEVEAAMTRSTAAAAGGPAIRRDDPRRPPTVGREQEGAALRAGFEEAAAGRGSVLCVTGEPGLGKSTLAERFVDELTAGGLAFVARGRCSERLAGAEAYLPFLEALDSLLQGDGGAPAARAMKLLAPSWYAQLAPLAGDDPALAPAIAEARDASQERRKRELAVFLGELSRQRPVVVFLDDVHWADPSSVDLLAYLGGRCAWLRLLLVLTYRPSDLLRAEHPFGPVKLDLEGRGVCREVALPFLSRADFDRYLALAFAGHQFPEELAAVLHARTEGNPLFMVDLLRYLRDRGVIVQDQGCWVLARALPDLPRDLPASIRAMVQRTVDQLIAADRHLLMAASVFGPEFGSVGLSEVLGRETADVEERLAVLASVHGLVRLVGERTLPDGVVTVRYGFIHALYQNALYAALQPTRKAAWSAAAAQALLRHYGEKSVDRAADLAVLFEVARDPGQATDHYRIAAENAARLFAHHEAVTLARRGLAQVQKLPDTPERARRELSLQLTLGIQLQVGHSFAAPEAERIYARAQELYDQVGEPPLLFPVLWGLWMFYEVSGEPKKSRELAERLFALAQTTQAPTHFLRAHNARVVTCLCLGDLATARENMEHGVALYQRERNSSHNDRYGLDPGVACLSFGAVALWLLGYPDQAVRRSREAITLGAELGQAGTRATSLYFATVLRQYRREGAAVRQIAEAAAANATEHGFSFWLASSRLLRGWALAEQGAAADGIAEMRQGLDGWAAVGSVTYQTYHLALLAEALVRDGRIEEALGVLADALARMHGSGESFHGAELHRLRGEFLLRQGAAEGAGREAEDCFRRAVTIARQQQARSLELRAAMSLTRLYQKQGRPAEARPVLAECYGWFTEGFDTPDLQEAKLLLEQLA